MLSSQAIANHFLQNSTATVERAGHHADKLSDGLPPLMTFTPAEHLQSDNIKQAFKNVHARSQHHKRKLKKSSKSSKASNSSSDTPAAVVVSESDSDSPSTPPTPSNSVYINPDYPRNPKQESFADIFGTLVETIGANYTWESVETITDDNVALNLFVLTGDENGDATLNPNQASKGPVLLLHGLSKDSTSWFNKNEVGDKDLGS